LNRVILLFILVYKKYISPYKPRTCRFYPTCSEYMYQAVRKFGTGRGLKLGIKRVLRCNPFTDGGYDPLPDKLNCDRKGRF
jgi:putative membrane protein insertion efficiency factor